jgi:hypothetical protein
MFPHSGSNHIIKELDGEPFMENSSVLQDMKENVNASLEGYFHPSSILYKRLILMRPRELSSIGRDIA